MHGAWQQEGQVFRFPIIFWLSQTKKSKRKTYNTLRASFLDFFSYVLRDIVSSPGQESLLLHFLFTFVYTWMSMSGREANDKNKHF